MEIEQNQSLENLRKNIENSLQNKLKVSLIDYIFQNQNTLKLIENQYSLLPKGLCAKSIQNQQRSYKCYDCGRDNQYHIYCQSCFLNGNHEDHRYKRSLQRTGCCDCGDQNAIIQQGFCKLHQGFKSLNIPPVDISIRQRLEIALQILFQKLFNLCQQCNYKGIKKFEKEQQINIQQSQEKLREYKFQIKMLLDVISQFISQFCKNKIPILYEIGKIFCKKKQHVRHHVCKQQNLKDSFKGTYESTQHLCKSSIVDDIYLYSLFLQGQKQLMTKFLFALFISPEFKKQLVESYVQKYPYLIEINSKQQDVLKSQLHSIYTQFFSKELVLKWTQSEHFNKIFKIIENLFDLLLTEKYNKGYQALLSILNVIFFLQNRFEEHKLNIENYKIINQFIRVSFKSVPSKFISVEQQKYRLYCDYLIILAVSDLIKSFDFSDIHVKQYIKTLILQYFQTAVQRTQTIDQYCQKHPAFNWFNLSEKLLGILLTVYFVVYGKQEVQNLVNHYLKDQVKNIVKRLLLSFTFQKKIQELNIPFNTFEETPKDILKWFYRCSNFYLHDSDLLCLQMFAMLINPDQFIGLLLDTNTKNINNKRYFNQIVLQLILEQSYFLNISSVTQLKSQLFNESLKCYIITAFNYKKKMTVQDLINLFQKLIFTKKMNYKKVLPLVCKFDKQSRTFFLNSEYHGLSQNYYFHRNKQLRQKIYDNQHTVKYNIFIKDNLIQKLVDNKINTFCSLVSQNLSQSNKLQIILYNIFKQLWDRQVISNQDLIQLKIISVLFTRNKNNEVYISIVKKLKSQLENMKKGTQIQKILETIFTKYDEIKKHQMQIESEVLNQKDKIKSHRQKILEQMKKKQKKFIQNNQIIFEKKQSIVQQKQNCLICCESLSNQHLSVIPITKIKVEAYENNIFQCFNTCNHKYHLSCLSKKTYRFCPLCSLYFNSLLPQTHQLFQFYRPEKLNNSIALNNNIPVDKKQIIQAIDIFGLHYIGQQNIQKINKLNICIFQMILSKICLSIQDSIETFFSKVRLAVRSAFGVLIFLGGINQSFQQFNIDDQRLILQVLNNKIEFYCKFIKYLLFIPLSKNSKETLDQYKKSIKRVYNVFLAANIISHFKDQKLEIGETMSLFTIKKQIFEAYMRQFFKGILFTYSIIFDDNNINVFRKIQRDQQLPPFTQLSCAFFEVDHSIILQSYIIARQLEINVLFSQQSLIKQIQIIKLPHTYKQFHRQYYSKKCVNCNRFASKKQQKQYICLLCGIKICSRMCVFMNSKPETRNCIDHAKLKHCSFSVFIEPDEGQIVICQNDFAIQYGHLYQNEFGDSNNQIEKNWQKLVKNYNKIQRVLSLMQKHQVQIQIFSYLKNNRTKSIVI